MIVRYGEGMGSSTRVLDRADGSWWGCIDVERVHRANVTAASRWDNGLERACQVALRVRHGAHGTKDSTLGGSKNKTVHDDNGPHGNGQGGT